MDLAGESCALVKVQLTAKDVGFEGNVIPPVEYKGGEYWVYMTKGSRELRIKHLAVSPAFLPCHVSFADYGISGVEPLTTYVLTLLLGEKMQKLIIDYTPKDAMVLVDSKPYQEDGHLEITLPVGSYNYVIAKKGYSTIEGVAILNKDTPRTIIESLKPEKNSEIVQAPMKQQDSQVNNDKEQERTAQQQALEHQTVSQETKTKVITLKKKFDDVKDNSILGTHTVKKKETIFGICRIYNITVHDLVTANPEMTAPGYELKRGVVLKIPYPQQTQPQISQSEPLSEPQKVVQTSDSQLPSVIQNLINNMVYVEGGTFTMGATSDQKSAHQVTVPSFSIGKYEVTQEEWEAVMGSNPSHFLGPKLPVEHVSMLDCQIFIDKLNHLTGKKFRLPTEAEWEYAAKGGGKSNSYLFSGSNNFSDVAWYHGNSGSSTHDVGQKAHNELGLYDMSGNVYEWCWFQNQDEDTPEGMGSMGVGRGGCWVDKLENCRVSARTRFPSDLSCNLIGFRLAL